MMRKFTQIKTGEFGSMKRRGRCGVVKRFLVTALTAAMIFSLAACDANTAKNNKDASGSAVDNIDGTKSISGSAVDLDGEDMGLTSFSDKALWNSTNYYEDYYLENQEDDDERDGLIQYTRDGKKVKDILFDEVPENCYNWYYVDDNYVVYALREEKTMRGDDDYCETLTVYQMPVEKGKDGNDVLKKEDAEKLFRIKGAYEEFACSNVYVDADYVVVVTNLGRYFRYDRKSGELIKEKPFESGEKRYYNEYELLPGSAGTQEIYVSFLGEDNDYNAENILYCQDLNTMEWKELLKNEDGKAPGFCLLVSQGNHVLFRSYNDNGERMYLRDFDKDKMTCVVTDKMCRDILVEEKFATKGELRHVGISSVDVGMSGDRHYFTVSVETVCKNVCQTCYVMFSVGIKDGTLVYEKKLTEYMWDIGMYKYVENPKGESYSGTENVKKLRTNIAACQEVNDGKALIFYEKEGTGQYRIYNLSTGDSRKLKKSDDMWDEDYGEDEEEEYASWYKNSFPLWSFPYLDDDGRYDVEKVVYEE